MASNNARIYINPNTGESGQAAYHAKVAGISTATFYQRIRKWGEGDPRCYCSEIEGWNSKPTAEYLALDDTEKSMASIDHKVGSWERDNVKKIKCEEIEEPRVSRGRPKKEVRMSEGERVLYDAFISAGDGEHKTISIAQEVGYSPKKASNMAYSLVGKGFFAKGNGRGVYRAVMAG